MAITITFVNSLSDSIAKGDLEVTRVNSLVGKDGVPYLTQAHLDSLKKVSESVNRNMDTRMVEYDSGYTAGMVYVKYPSGVRGEIQIVGEKVLDIANAEHIPYDAFLGKPYAGAFPKENLGKASEILDPIRTAATSLDEVQKAKYLGYLNSQYTRARQIEQGASPAAVNLPEGISGKLSVDNLIKANGVLNKLKVTNSSSAIELLNNGIKGKSIDPAYLSRMKAAFERNGGVIDQSADAQAYLQMRGNAEGLTFNDKTILLPESPTRSAVFEEFIHTSQHRRGLVNEYAQKYGNSKAELRLEIEAAEKLINNRKSWQLPNNETKQTIQRLRDMRQELLERQ